LPPALRKHHGDMDRGLVFGLWRISPVVISVLLTASGSNALGLASSLVLEVPIYTG